MEALFVSLIQRLSGEFKELQESFKELKVEIAVLRNEILGIGDSAASSGQNGMGLMEKTTLRELVEQIQFDLKALSAKVETSLRGEECSGNPNKPLGETREGEDLSSADNVVDDAEVPVERFPVVEIKFKTVAQQRDWMMKTFADSIKQRSVSEGASFGGKTVETISSSVVPYPTMYSTACTIKLSNFLSYALTDPRFQFWQGTKISGPSRVDPKVTEVLTFQGAMYQCMFLCSFGISSSLRLVIFSFTHHNGCVQFGMAFTPQDVPKDHSLLRKLEEMPSAPDVFMHVIELLLQPSYKKEPMEAIINHRKLLARGHMSPGSFSVIHIEIMEVGVAFPVHADMNPLEDGESISATLTYRSRLHGLSLDKTACIIDIGNCLSSTLKNRSGFFCNSSRNNFLPSEILPFYRERFLASDNKTVEAFFSFEIESTDCCLIVAVRSESGNNSFAVAFAPIPVKANRNEFVALMDPMAWKTQLYRKYAHAKDGEQVIELGNIRASVKMTEDAESLLNIRVYAV